MLPRLTLRTALTVTLAGFFTPLASAQEAYRDGRLRLVEPGVTLQRATESAAEEAFANTPFLPGDRVWTDGRGRAEFQFPDGSSVRVDRRSKIDYAGHDERGGERIVLRLWSGSLFLRVRSRGAERFEIETPAGTVRGLERSLVRIDVDAGEARVSVYEGEAVLDLRDGDTRLAAGERTYLRWGERAQDPERFDLYERDDFERWNEDCEAGGRWDARSAEYLPQELDFYAGELGGYGDWRLEPTVGYVWIPRVEVGWRPYWSGHWAWTFYGWTWIPNERWGWAPFHYGRWEHSISFGWYWIPGHTWGPAWVSWASGGGYVGWCPLGRHDRPVVPWGRYDREMRFDRGHAVPRRTLGGLSLDAWNVVPQGELGRHDLAQRRVAIDRVPDSTLRVADSIRLRPTRDARSLSETGAVPRAISTRPRPGDFVRELAVDNRTTIPSSPWFRRGDQASPRSGGSAVSRAPGQGDDGRRYGQAAGGAESAAARHESVERRAPWFARPNTGDETRSGAAAARRSPETVERQATRPEWGPSAAPITRAPVIRESDPGAGRHAESAARRAPRPWSGPAEEKMRERENEPARAPAFRAPERTHEQSSPRSAQDREMSHHAPRPQPEGHAARPSGGEAPRNNDHAVSRRRNE